MRIQKNVQDQVVNHLNDVLHKNNSSLYSEEYFKRLNTTKEKYIAEQLMDLVNYVSNLNDSAL